MYNVLYVFFRSHCHYRTWRCALFVVARLMDPNPLDAPWKMDLHRYMWDSHINIYINK